MGTIESHHKEVELTIEQRVELARDSHGDFKKRLGKFGELLAAQKFLSEEQTQDFYNLTKAAKKAGNSDASIDQYIEYGRRKHINGGVLWVG